MTIGIDEVGRGCWAGPLVVSAVALKRSITGMADSKLLSNGQREVLARKIRMMSDQIQIAWVPPHIIDRIGLSDAMRLACSVLYSSLSIEDGDEIVLDGSVNYLPDTRTQVLAKADSLVSAVSAASIIAKVARDGYMHATASLYPKYGFDKHVGYGTPRHIQALELMGPCAIHRRSFSPIARFSSI